MNDNAALKDKVYIVTGASKGFGLGICTALLERGAKVAMLARNNKDLLSAAKQLGDQYGNDKVFSQTCDVSNSQQVKESFVAVKNHFKQLNGLINNAGLARPGSVETLREDEVLLQVNTNFVGTVLCCQAAIGLLRGEDNPRIINISSASAWHYDEMLHLSIYAATKAAVERFTRDLRIECQKDNIGVTCVRPGAAWTNFADGWDEKRLMAGVAEWSERFGPVADSGMEISHVADSICYSLSCPPGVAVDMLEIRPNRIDNKTTW